MRAINPSELTGRWEPLAELPGVALGRTSPRTPPAAIGDPRHHPAAAILFADIVGFTRLCERLPPQAAFRLLHGFHGRMANAATLHGAAIFDTIGDGIMAVWTGPDGDENAARALLCAFAMLDAVAAWATEHDGASAPLAIGVGLHAGPVMVGRTGGPHRPKCSAFSDTVNIAHRLERLTRSRAAVVVASDALFRRAATARPSDPRLDRFGAAENTPLPGRAAAVRIRVAA